MRFEYKKQSINHRMFDLETINFLNEQGNYGWQVVAIESLFGVTNVILMREL